MNVEGDPNEPSTVDGMQFAEQVAKEGLELKVRHPLRDNEAHAALFAVSEGEFLCRCQLPVRWRSTPGVLTEVVAALVCDEVFLLDQAPFDMTGGQSGVEVFWVASTGDIAHSVLPYRIETGSVSWGPTRRTRLDGIDSGRDVDTFLTAMSSGLDGQDTVLDRDAARLTLDQLGVHAMFSDDLAMFDGLEVSDPCPCESGLRFGECHGLRDANATGR